MFKRYKEFAPKNVYKYVKDFKDFMKYMPDKEMAHE